MSSPAIAGVCGLLLSYNNDLTLEELKSIFSCTEYGFTIANNGFGTVIQHGFGAPVGDFRFIANNPNQCQSLASANSISFDESVSNNIEINGDEHFYRISIT